MRFDPDDVGRMAMYVDGDGDGVRQYDVDAGVDQPIADPGHVSDHFWQVAFEVPHSLEEPDGSSVIAAGSDAVRIGSSNFLSFNPHGTATSGTIYLAGRDGTQACVRVLGATGRVRVLRYDRSSRSWHRE